MVGYLAHFTHFNIKLCVNKPDLSCFDSKIKIDSSKSVYAEHKEEIPKDAPKPFGKQVSFHYYDANPMHDALSGKAITGSIHFANKTPLILFSKRQTTSQKATHGSEFIAGRTVLEQAVDLHPSLRYLDVPINNVSYYVFGNNASMVNKSSYHYARLHKRRNIPSFHCARSVIATGAFVMH